MWLPQPDERSVDRATKDRRNTVGHVIAEPNQAI